MRSRGAPLWYRLDRAPPLRSAPRRRLCIGSPCNPFAAARSPRDSLSPSARPKSPVCRVGRARIPAVAGCRWHRCRSRPALPKLAVSPTSSDELPCEVLRAEGQEVLRLFADADELDWDAEVLGDADDRSAFGGAVELGYDRAGYTSGL